MNKFLFCIVLLTGCVSISTFSNEMKDVSHKAIAYVKADQKNTVKCVFATLNAVERSKQKSVCALMFKSDADAIRSYVDKECEDLFGLEKLNHNSSR